LESRQVKFRFDNGCDAAARALEAAVGGGNLDEVEGDFDYGGDDAGEN
jgi:hypothetical protein